MEITAHRAAKAVVFDLNGALTINDGAARLQEFTALNDAPHVVLNCRKVCRMDCTGIGALVRLNCALCASGVGLTLVGVDVRQQRMLQMVGLGTVFALGDAPAEPSERSRIMALSIGVRHVEGVCVMKVSGRLVMGDPAHQFHSAVRRLVHQGERSIVLDFSGVSYIDSAGLGETIGAYASVVDNGGRIALLNPSSKMTQLMQIAKLATVFDIFESEAEAVDAMAPAQSVR